MTGKQKQGKSKDKPSRLKDPAASSPAPEAQLPGTAAQCRHLKASCSKPAPLKNGDKVALISPSSRPAGPHVIAAAQRILNEMGFKPVIGKHVLGMHGYLAGTDEERLEDLNQFIRDSSVRAIFCTTGGYGSLRLLDQVDYQSLQDDPKIFFGCDDNTCLLAALNQHAGIVVFHGRNLDSIDSQASFDEVRRCLASTSILPPVLQLADFSAGSAYAPVAGRKTGILQGGNMSSFLALMGTRHQPELADRILFLEDINERNDILERAFTGLYLSGQLSRLKAVAFGKFQNCGPHGSSNLLSLEELFGEWLIELGLPACFGLAIGQHGDKISATFAK